MRAIRGETELEIKDYKGVWVFVEQRDSKLLDVGIELLGAGRILADKLGQELCAVVLGQGIAAQAKTLGGYGADVVYIAESPQLKVYNADAYAIALSDLAREHRPAIFLVGGTAIGMDLAPRVAAKLNTGLSAHAVQVDVDKDGCMLAKVPSFGGAVMASIACPRHRPQMATIPAGIFVKPAVKAGKQARVETVKVALDPKKVRTRTVEVFREELKSKPIEQSDVIVAGGYGVGKENWKVVEDLAAVLGAGVGATRPACDEGWARLETQMIGQSGKTVRPKLYIGMGISGMVHHLIGIKDSKVIVAINRDEKAPIMSSADYAVVGDLKEIVPALIAELKKTKK